MQICNLELAKCLFSRTLLKSRANNDQRSRQKAGTFENAHWWSLLCEILISILINIEIRNEIPSGIVLLLSFSIWFGWRCTRQTQNSAVNNLLETYSLVHSVSVNLETVPHAALNANHHHHHHHWIVKWSRRRALLSIRTALKDSYVLGMTRDGTDWSS